MKRSIVVLAALLGLACGKDPGGPVAQLAVTIDIVGGDSQVTNVGKELAGAIVAQVRDDKSALPVKGVLVSWVVVSGGGSVFAGSALTDSLGKARERWTLGTAIGQQVLEARAVDENGQAVTYTRVTATANADVAFTFALSTPSNVLHVGDTARVWYSYRDQYGNLTRTCADGGSADRVVWASADSTRAAPVAGVYADSTGTYGKVVGKAVGLVGITGAATWNGAPPGCVSGMAGIGSTQGYTQFNVQ